MNKVILIGNTASDPVKTVSGETTICRFSVAVNRRFVRAGEERTADFFRVTAFGKLAEVTATYLTKGKKVGVSGSLQMSEYTDKEGIKRQSIDVVADEVEFLSPKGSDEHSGDGYPSAPRKVATLKPVSDDSLPF